MFNVPSFFGFRAGGSVVPLLLDTYTGVSAAYSLRGLSTPYVKGLTPYACQVRNSSNVALNIGFIFNSLTGDYDLDTAALLAHCGGGNGFVDVWYDQGGNARNASQVIALNQPQIVSSGSVILDNGKPSVQFIRSNVHILNCNQLLYTTNTIFVSAVANFVLQGANMAILGQNGNTGAVGRSNLGLQGSSSKSLYFFNNGSSFSNLSAQTIVNSSQNLLTYYSESNNYFNALNGSSGNNNVIGQSFIPNAPYATIGGIGSITLGDLLDGKIQEILVWNSDQTSNKIGIETNINNFYSIYP